MPKRIVDGDALWRSQKLSQVQPPAYRAEFANLIPLALANGVFEADPELIWATVYAYNRPDIGRQEVVAILSEFERVGLLRRWLDVNGIPQALNGFHVEGKVWGYWIGIEKPGRLPGQSRQGKNERIGPTPFLSMDSIKQPIDSIKQPTGTDLSLGSGFGLGSGSGVGVTTPLWCAHRIIEELSLTSSFRLKDIIAESVKAEAGYLGMELEETTLRIIEYARRDRKAGISIDKFYFEDTKWRTQNSNSKRSDGFLPPQNVDAAYIPESVKRKNELAERKALGL